jgi:HPt (histidine-containing phosphotransfer) domain-containing protein
MTDPAALIAARLAQLWLTSRPTILERVAVLRASLDALRKNPEDADARSQGREAAHKLSGVLGVFGLPQGSEIAASLEHILKSSEPLTLADVPTIAEQVQALAAVIAAKDNP